MCPNDIQRGERMTDGVVVCVADWVGQGVVFFTRTWLTRYRQEKLRCPRELWIEQRTHYGADRPEPEPEVTT